MGRARTMAWLAAVGLIVFPADLYAQAGTPRPAHARPLAQSLPSDAKRDYDAGKLLFEDGDYATALLKYQAAYDATRDARLLWDVAVCQKSLRHYAMALATLRQYLADGGDLLSAGDRHDAQELSRAITPFTSAQTLRVSEPGAQVWIDDRPAGTSPLAGPVVLDIGTRRVRVRKDGFRVWDRDMPVGGSAPTAVDVTLEKQAGHLDLTVPAEATVTVDDREIGQGPSVSLDLGVGPHALRVTAPRMRPLATDVVVEDGGTRKLDVKLEQETAPSSEVHVAVGCGRPEPLPTDGLSVFFDDATESAPPLGVRVRREPGRDVIAYIPYRVAPGRHTVHVASLECESRDATVDAPEGGSATVSGALPPSDSWYEGSPAGSHDGWRLSAGPIATSVSFGDYENFFQPGRPAPGPVGFALVGASVATGFEGRWITGLLDARVQTGRVTGVAGTTEYDSTLSQWTVGVRPGLRVPLYVVALSGGVGLHVGEYYFSPDSGSPRSGLLLSGSAWAAVDVQPWCEWGVQLAVASSTDGYSQVGATTNPTAATSFWLHVAFSPNRTCKRREAGLFSIEGNAR